MNEICRICMIATQNTITLMESIEGVIGKSRYGQMFEECIMVELNELKEFRSICVPCSQKLSDFSDFKVNALTSHKKLKKLEDEANASTIKEYSVDNCINVDNFTKIETNYFLPCEYDKNQIDHETVSNISNDSINENRNTNSEEMYESEILSIEHLTEEEMKTFNERSLSESDPLESGFLRAKEVETSENLIVMDEMNTNKSNIHFSVDKNGQVLKPMKSILKVRKKRFKCKECGSVLKLEETFKAHMNVHRGLPPYTCDKCNKHFGFKNNYDYHMKNHDNERNFRCTKCDKKFLVKWDLRIHMRVHANERPFDCSTCGKKFRVSSHLTDHLETHKDEKNYVCPYFKCNQKFKTRSSLKTHQHSIHERSQRFSCTFCNKAFNRNHHLKAHLKRHENEIH